MWKEAVENLQGTRSDPDAHDLWTRAAGAARGRVSASTYDMWFADVRGRRLAGDTIELAIPTEYARSWLSSHHEDLIRNAVEEAAGRPLDVRMVVEERPEAASGPAAGVAAERGRDDVPPYQRFPDLYTFETFVLGPSNRFAHAAAMAVAEAPPSKAYNPLFIYGGVGLGKTHLLYALATHISKLIEGVRVKYVTSEAFVTEFIRAVRERQGYQFQRRYRDVDVLLVDDIQFLARAEETQTEFFHTFNALHGSARQIVIASDRPPQELAGLEERLRNRFRWGLCVDVQPPDLETRIAILQKKAERDHMKVPDAVQHFIATKFDMNIRELEGALLRVAAFASLSGVKVDLPLAERALEDLIPQTGQEIPPELIMEQSAQYFSLRRADLVSKSRSRPLTTARHIAMYLLRELSGLSLIKIGELFDRDHSTALHGIKKIEALMPARGSTYRQVQELTKTVRTLARGGR